MPRKGKQRRLDLTGQTFSNWTVLKKGDIGLNGAIYWICRCKCGTEKSVQAGSLRGGKSTGCGCVSWIRHGQSFTPTGRAWYGMRQRCGNPNDKNYPSYGGRGIKVCERWLESLENFVADMGYAPKGLTLDRIDVDGNYEPSNCRWASRRTQQRNRRNNPKVEYKGQMVNIVDLAEMHGLTNRTLRYRLSNGWDLETALSTPQQAS